MAAGSRSHVVLCAALALALVGGCGGLDNGLGLTPPMGFNTWNYFGCAVLQRRQRHPLTAPCLSCNVTEQTILDAAQALVALGLKQVGALLARQPRLHGAELLKANSRPFRRLHAGGVGRLLARECARNAQKHP